MTVELSTGWPFKIDPMLHMEVLVSMDIGQQKPDARKYLSHRSDRTCNHHTLTFEFADVSIPQLADNIFAC